MAPLRPRPMAPLRPRGRPHSRACTHCHGTGAAPLRGSADEFVEAMLRIGAKAFSDGDMTLADAFAMLLGMATGKLEGAEVKLNHGRLLELMREEELRMDSTQVELMLDQVKPR